LNELEAFDGSQAGIQTRRALSLVRTKPQKEKKKKKGSLAIVLTSAYRTCQTLPHVSACACPHL